MDDFGILLHDTYFFLLVECNVGTRTHTTFILPHCIFFIVFFSLSLNAIIRSMHTVFLDVDLQGLAVVGVVGLSFNGHEMC